MTCFSHSLRTYLASSLLLSTGLTAQTVWTGAASGAWSDSANWTAGVPNSVSDAIIPITSNVPSTAGSPFPAVRNLTVQAGAAFTISPAAPLDVFGSINSEGAISGEMRLRGGGTIATGVTGSLDTVRIVTGNYTIVDAIIDELLQDPAAGPVVIDNASVTSLAVFTGAGLVGSPQSVFECNGPVQVNTTVPTTTPPELMVLHSDWVSSASWQPGSGKVEFSASTPLSATIAANTHWFDLDVQTPLNVSSDLIVDGALRMSRDIIVNGATVDLVERVGIAGNSSITAATATSLRIRNGVTATGSIICPNAVMDADGDMTFLASGSLEVGNGVHRVSGSLDMNGAFTVPTGSVVDFDGSGNISLSPASLLPGVRFSGSDITVLNLLVLGDCEQTASAGNLNISNLAVAGNCTLAGASVNDYGAGQLDALGNLSIQTSSIVNTPPALINCSGTFSSNANFQPQSGLVVLDGPGVQAVNRPAFQWNDLHIEAGTQIVTASEVVALGELQIRGELATTGASIDVHGPLNIAGTLVSSSAASLRARAGLTVDGTMFTPAAAVDVDGDFTVGGFVDVGNGDHRITGSLLVAGSFQMPPNQSVIFDGTGSVSVVQTSTLSDVRFAGGDYDVASLRATGGLDHNSGVLTIGSCSIDGDALFRGAGLTGAAGSVLNIGGSLNIRTANVVDTPPSIMRCGGDWTSDASFAPQSGLVEFNGNGDQVVLRPAFSWIDLRIQPGSVVYSTLATQVAGDFDVRGQLNCFGPSIQVDGAMTVRSTGFVQASSAASLTVAGDLQVDGTVAMTASAMTSLSDVLVSNSGAVALGAGPHMIHSSLTVLGNLTVPALSETRFVGTGLVNLTSGNPLGNVVFDGGDITVAQAVARGAVNHSSGQLSIAALSCAGTANFSGTNVVDFAGGLLEVGGTISFATSGVVTNPPSQIRCSGNWTSDDSFAPQSGIIEMVGVLPQEMSATMLQLANLSVAPGSEVRFKLDEVGVTGNLLLNGILHAPNVLLAVGNDLTVGVPGALLMPPTVDCSIAGSVANSGTIQGDPSLRLIGAGTISGSSSYPGLSVEGTGDYVVNGAVDIDGDLAVSSGALALGAGASLHASGNMSAIGGVLRGAAASLLDVDGDAVIDGMLADSTGAPDMNVGGSYHASSAFAPFNGTTTLDGAGDVLALDGTLVFANLVVGGSAHNLANDAIVSAADIDIASGASLDLGSRRLDMSAPTMMIEGGLSIGSAGTLFLTASSAVEVAAGGSLQMIGTWDDPAVVDGPAGAGYSFAIRGNIAASNYTFRNMDAAGIVVDASAVIAAAPNDMRAGHFLDGAAVPGSCLLHVDRNAATELRYIELESSGTTYGVRSLGLGAVSFVNESGNRAGAAFEDDPNARIDWLPAQRTEVIDFAAIGSLHNIRLDLRTAREVDVQDFRLLRSPSATGPFTEIAVIGANGSVISGASYTRNDATIVDGEKYYYRIDEVLNHGEPRLLAEDFARSYDDRAGDTTFVGPNGLYPDLVSAVAVTPVGGSIAVAAGTYPAFTLNKAVRIFPVGDGPVIIDTTLSKMVIRDIPASSADMGLYSLIVGGPASPNGMEVVNCDNIIILDGLEVRTASIAPALVIDDSTHIAVQNCELSGGPGLRFDNASTCYLSRGSINSMEVLRNSDVTYCDVTPGSLAVGIGSSAVARAGAMPDIYSPIGWTADKAVNFDMSGQPNSFFVLLFSFRRGWTDMTPVFPLDMVLLLGQSGATTFSAGIIGPNGTAQFSLTAPGSPSTFGSNVPLQVVGLDAVGGRFGTTREAVFLP